MKRIKFAVLLSWALSLAAFGLFVTNQWHELAGSHLDLRGESGATVLTGFLALGIMVQILRVIQGSDRRLEVVFTLVMLLVHVAAEMLIWVRTQIAGLTLPHNLPYYIIGFYWVIGVADVLSRYLERELAVLTGDYVSPEQRITALEHRNELLEMQLSDAERSLSKAQSTLEKQQEEASRTYDIACTCGWSGSGYRSEASARRALAAHQGATGCQGRRVSSNGHKEPAMAI